MNDQLHLLLTVSRWEFQRFFKISDMIKGTLFFLVMGAVGFGASMLLSRDALSIPDIAVQQTGPFSIEALDHPQLNFLDQRDQSPEQLRAELDEGAIEAILTIESLDLAHLIAPGERAWTHSLRQHLDHLRTDRLLSELQIEPEDYERLTGSVEVNTEYLTGRESSRADRILAGVAIGLVLVAVFMGFAYQFTAITAEKQQRITEQVVSAIRPQTWIDGKILGITGIGLVYVVYYAALGLIGTAILTALGAPFGAVLALVDPLLVVCFVLLALLGILMWNAFLAAIAATIDDPNTSQKTGWMMLPMLPVGLAFFALVNPDSLAMKFLGIFPLSSFAVMPARMVLTTVAAWEILLAFALLAATVWLFRRAAGKIFAAGMMMYGKEPGWREMWHLFRRA